MAGENYVKGRAGELTVKANPETFELVKDIFGKDGPFRKVLYKYFGIGNPYIKQDFVVFKNGEVLTDIDEETRILWESVMHKLVKKGEKAELVADMSLVNLLVNGGGLVKKILIDSWIILNINGYLSNAKKRYKKYAEFTEKILNEKHIERKEFLRQYENVVYVTYLYEILNGYNTGSNKNAENTQISGCLNAYVKRNDLLLNYDLEYDEFKYKNVEGFSLGETEKSKLFEELGNDKFNLIPGELEECDCEDHKLITAEKVLQCFKDNMRLKSQVQLFVMNYQNQDT